MRFGKTMPRSGYRFVETEIIIFATQEQALTVRVCANGFLDQTKKPCRKQGFIMG
jgi:DNA-binding winged helix-turn-helix (wHTH) protein